MFTVQEKKVTEKTLCYHCGDPCEDDAIHFANKSFCCAGCKAVFEILEDNGLLAYYQLENKPGNTVKPVDSDKFSYLDNELILERLLDFSSERVQKVSFLIPSIHCSSCIWLLENLSRLHPGVSHSVVNFIKKTATITFDPHRISLRRLVELLDRMGYPPSISLETGERKKENQYTKRLSMKIGLAAFCFGNVMLLSFPEYLGLTGETGEFGEFFSYLNIFLALPVLLYSASDYFISAWKGLREYFINIDVPIALGMITLFSRSVYEIAFQVGPGYLDSFTGFVFFLLVGKWFQGKTYQSLSFERDYKSYFPLAVTRVGNNSRVSVPIEQLRVGDVIEIRNQEIIPADGLLVSEQANLDYSFVTGEANSVPVNKGKTVYAGGRQVGEKILLKIKKKTDQSYLTELWNGDSFKKATTGQYKHLVDRVSQYFTLIVLLVAISAAAYWYFQSGGKTWEVFTAVLIVACPCALALSSPFTYGSVVRVLGRNRFYLKSADVVEQLSRIDHIVFDKTGTITQNEGSGVVYHGVKLTSGLTKRIAVLAENSSHPLSRKVYDFLNEQDGQIPAPRDFREIAGKGISAWIEDDFLKLGSADFVGVEEPGDINVTRVFLSVNGICHGHFEVRSHYRSGMSGLVRRLARQKVPMSILSGDNEGERPHLQKIFPPHTTMSFRQDPQQKMDFVKELQAKRQSVLMAGDGLNDAGALQQSNVGIAVSDDLATFSPACDGILSGDKLTLLDKFLKLSSTANGVVIVSFVISLLYNLIGVSFAVSGLLTPIFAAILMPLSSISVVLFTTLSIKLVSVNLRLS